MDSWTNRATDANYLPVPAANPMARRALALVGFRRPEGRGVCRACAVSRPVARGGYQYPWRVTLEFGPPRARFSC